MVASPLVGWLSFVTVGTGISGPNRFLVPLLLASLFLIVGWIATWSAGNGWRARQWAQGGLALLLAGGTGILGGTVVMGFSREPLHGMLSIFAIGDLTWVILTAVFWSRNGAG